MTISEVKQKLQWCPNCEGREGACPVTIEQLWPILLGIVEAIERIEQRLEGD